MSLISAPSANLEAYVLDSWPLLEQMLKSASMEDLGRLIESAARATTVLVMSEISVGEVFYRVAKEKGEERAEAALSLLRRLPVQILPVSPGEALRAARLKARFPISYADCFCAQLAMDRNASVVTGDADFLLLERAGLLRVKWLGA